MAALIPPPPPSSAPLKVAAFAGPPGDEGLPKRFGKYTLLRKLATGGMAELFLALQKSVAGFEKLLVIKRILPQMNRDKAFIDMLTHEARIAATLAHPNIVQIFDVGEVDGVFYIAMEHVHGEDLRSMVRQMKRKGVNEFPLEHAITIILAMCNGLAYAHEKRGLDGTPLNIVHRDISPQNVVVTFTGDVKVVDFGIAKSDARGSGMVDTKTGRLKGKIPYMSPEQARGELTDWRTDIFAAGVMLFELTTGKRLFKGPSEFETLKLICDRDYPRPTQVRAGYPLDLEPIVMRALAKEPEHRFQSAREMQAALEHFARDHRIPASTIGLSQFMQGLFEDKLAAQKQELLEGKQLADILAEQSPTVPDAPSEIDLGAGSGRLSSSLISTPAASRTVTGIASPRRRTLVPLFLGVGGAAVVATVAVAAALYWVKKKEAAAAAPLAPPPIQSGAIAVAPLVRGAIAIATDPPGASLWIDGEARAEATPTTLTKIALDKPLEIRVHKDGYEDVSRTLTLTEAEPSAAVMIPLKRGTFTAEIVLKPFVPGASLIVDGKPQTSLSAAGLTAGESHRVVVFAPGYAAQQVAVTGSASEKKHFDVTLLKADPKDRSAASLEPPPVPAPTVSVPPPAPAPAPPAGTGRINVGARGGWCNVVVDGAGRGPTPVAGISVSAGPHTVTCTTEGGKTFSAVVNVQADATARYMFTIPE